MLRLPRVPNLTEMAYLSVRKYLLDGSLTEGERLTEESVATRLGISKSPVREALNRLETEGLIVISPRRGAFVRRFTLEETRDLYNVREVLETYAVRVADVSPRLIDELEQSIERTREHLRNGDKPGHVDEDVRFHSLLAASSGNGELKAMLENVQHKSLLSRSKTFHLSAPATPAGHAKILEALRRGDRTAAAEAMSEHIFFTRDALLTVMEQEGEEPTSTEPPEGQGELSLAADA
ncbi:transcriptional regulator, GntR family [Bryocella elongata]|uniref:Transcriptional regulator, GntR family n=1 Tax=Bryocella elongata TaxID=863522 RepID=A0A1H5SGB5_9BACT|nr:GntR family transcriptional regulator [Bryocella elongata]SEF49515.1 transcriptional regulator, GntR family [Bryocella elongata]